MKIGELADATATQVETIRFYEREGLLAEPRRTASNYRVYDDTHTDRLLFIRHCRALDMNLDEIRLLLRFKDAPEQDCGEVNSLLDEHIGHVERRMRELRSLDKELRALRDRCRQVQGAGHCGILNELSSASQRGSRRSASHVGRVHGAPAKPAAGSRK